MLYEEDILHVLKLHPKNEKAKQIVCIFDRKRNEIICECAFLVSVWTVVIGPYWSEVANIASVTQEMAKEKVEYMLGKLNRIIESPVAELSLSMPFEETRECNQEVFNTLECTWATLNEVEQRSLEIRFKNGLTKMTQKVLDYCAEILERSSEWNNIKVPLTTQP